MILDTVKKSIIYKENTIEFNEFWFDLKQKKFLNTIDSLYYSVLLDADFTNNKEEKKVRKWRNFWNSISSQISLIDDYVLNIPGVPMYFTVKKFSYGSGTYEFRLSRPDYYDIFISLRTANRETSQILVQLRSKALWIDGVVNTINTSLYDVKALCEYFGFNIINVQENRIDYCWHTNYIQAPQNFFKPDAFAKMRLSRLSDSNMHVNYYGREDFEIDYLTLGKKASKNVFFRIYLKSKEVVEMGYKAFFLKLWQLNGMISRYDLYCYEYAYEKRKWSAVYAGRIKFYAEYGSDRMLRDQCNDILNEKIKFNYDEMKAFADMITPPVTLVINVEYQTMRKFTSSIVLPNTLKSMGFEQIDAIESSRLWDVVDYYPAICEYLTNNVVRLVEMYGDENKSRRNDCPFWQCLKRSKSIDGRMTSADSEFMRNYDHQKNKHLQMMRILSSIAGKTLHEKGINEDSAEDDIIDFINSLNDNDLADYRRLKYKRMKRESYDNPVGLDVPGELFLIKRK